MRNALFGLACAVLAGCGEEQIKESARSLTGGDPDHGRIVIEEYGCGACHTIPGVQDASATVGPSLDQITSKNFIGGVLNNTPANMVRWLKDPPAVSPKTAMPNLGLKDSELRDVASYLYTIR
jgi:cytochrome c